MPAESSVSGRMSAEERRKQLIEVAIDLFSKKGFGGTTTKEIAAAAGVTEAIVFRHFSSKQEFYSAILDHIHSASSMAEWLADAQRLMDNKDDTALFRLLIESSIESVAREPRFERLMLLAAVEGHELAEIHMRQFALPIGERLVQYLIQRQKEGALVEGDPMAMLVLIAGAAKFYAQHRYIFAHQGASKGFCSPSDADQIAHLARYVNLALLTKQTPGGQER